MISADCSGIGWFRLIMLLCTLLVFWHPRQWLIWPSQCSSVSTQCLFPVVDQMVPLFILVPYTGLCSSYLIMCGIGSMTFPSMLILMICTINTSTCIGQVRNAVFICTILITICKSAFCSQLYLLCVP